MPGSNHKGFSLVELLIVVGLFGIFLGATYSLYIAHMKTAFTQEEIVDTQQNLRIAMDSISRDVAMAGFLVPSPVTTFANHSSVTNLAMATADKIYMRISGISAAALTYTVTPSASLRRFNKNDIVRCVSSEGVTHDDDSIFMVDALTVDDSVPANNIIRLKGISPAPVPPGVGDVICKIDPPPPAPNCILFETVSYAVSTDPEICGTGLKCIVRRVNSNPVTPANSVKQDVVAQIGSSAAGDKGRLRFAYLLKDGTEINSGLNADTAAELRAIRVTITGQTVRKADPGDVARTRQMTSVIRLRNRRAQ